MKHKTNKAKRVAYGCRNHGNCPICNGNRTRARVRIKSILADPELRQELKTRKKEDIDENNF